MDYGGREPSDPHDRDVFGGPGRRLVCMGAAWIFVVAAPMAERKLSRESDSWSIRCVRRTDRGPCNWESLLGI